MHAFNSEKVWLLPPTAVKCFGNSPQLCCASIGSAHFSSAAKGIWKDVGKVHRDLKKDLFRGFRKLRKRFPRF